jgi:glycosyltransferase involved in cell wall biosynthesis
MKPLVSVIIPTYNRKNFLKIAIDSVLNQSFNNFELLIIDDGSNDSTEELVKSFKDQRIRYFKLDKNYGPSYARNFGIKNSNADFVAFLDSDDFWKKEKLEIQYSEMLKNNDYLLSHTDEIWLRNGKILNPKKIHLKEGGDIFKKSLKLCSISISTVMAKKSLFDIVGFFDESLPACEDYDMWLRVTALFPVLFINKKLTVKHGGHNDQLSKRFVGMDKFRIYSIEKLIKSNLLNKEKLKLAIEELKLKCEIYGKGCIKHNKISEGVYYLELPKKYIQIC